MKKILVVFAHPALQKSRVNKVLIEGIKQIEGLTLHDLYEVYPDMDIDVEREQKLLEAHDVIIFQYPFFWYSSPALLKEYIDIVFQHDWAYGRKGNALKDRLFMVATTTGGNKQTYCPEGSNNFSIKQLLAPLEQTATLCKMKYLPPLCTGKALWGFGLTEPNAGSDVQGIKSTAIKHGDKYILNGHKRFITNGDAAEYITVFALADPSRGSRSLSAFAVHKDTPGITMLSRLDKMGQRASIQNEIKFENVEVPASNLFGGEGYGFLIAMKTFDRTRTGVAAAAIGNAQSAYDYSREWAKKRIQFGHPITNLQGVSFMLADMATEIEAARMLVWRAAWAYDTQQKDSSKLSAMSKYYATDVAMKVTTDAVQVMGGEGYSKEHPVEKMMRDAKLSQIYEGTNQVNRMVVSKQILK